MDWIVEPWRGTGININSIQLSCGETWHGYGTNKLIPSLDYLLDNNHATFMDRHHTLLEVTVAPTTTYRIRSPDGRVDMIRTVPYDSFTRWLTDGYAITTAPPTKI